MIERKVEVKTYTVYANCECGGQFESTGLCLDSFLTKYEHQCNKCGELEYFSYSYPKTVYEEIKQ